MKINYPADPIVAAIEKGEGFPYKEVIMGPGWVSDVLQEEPKAWDSIPVDLKLPILINAPTGLGKNTFVRDVLADYAAKQNKYVLLLTNRYTLNLQQKQDFSDRNHHPPFGTAIISAEQVIGHIITLLYHQVPYHLDRIILEYPIKYVVFDEVHFFCSDATFNVETCGIFRKILENCKYAKRIYMSATPEDVKALIAYEEKCLPYYKAPNSPRPLTPFEERDQLVSMCRRGESITEYRFPRDYSFVDLRFFSDWEKLAEIINNQESNEKWLIFVSSKEVGAKLKKDIPGSEFIDATYKNLYSEKIQRMARLEKFDEKILIATTVLYNGFSIRDDDLKNIVVDSADRVEVLQMLGRKRLAKKETIKLYVMEKGQETIGNLKRSCVESYQLLQEFTYNRYQFNRDRIGTLNESQQRLFAIGPGDVVYTNPHAPYQLTCMSGKYERLEDRFSREGKNAFINEVCSWFGIQYAPEMGETLHDRIKRRVIDFTEQHIDHPMAENEFATFKEQFMMIIDPLIKEMNRIRKNTIRNDPERPAADIDHTYKFFALPYRCKKNKTFWIISKVTSPLTDSDDGRNDAEE